MLTGPTHLGPPLTSLLLLVLPTLPLPQLIPGFISDTLAAQFPKMCVSPQHFTLLSFNEDVLNVGEYLDTAP